MEYLDKEQLLEALTESFAEVKHTIHLGREFGGSRELPIPARSLAHQAVRIFEQFQEPWKVFDKDDEKTWPDESVSAVWVIMESFSKPRAVQWLGSWERSPWQIVTYWQPIPVPAPPSEAVKDQEQ